MTKTNLGRVVPLPKGDYDATKTYERLDVVSFEGSSYICIDSCKGVAPTDASKWQLVAEKGERGVKGDKGDKGDKGEQGNSGYTGAADELEVVNNLSDGGAEKALSAEMGVVLDGKLSELEEKTQNDIEGILDVTRKLHPSTNKKGWFVVDSDGNIAAQIDEEGFDVFRLAEHLKKLIRQVEGVLSLANNKGFFVSDGAQNIGMKYDEEGLDFAKIAEHAVQVLKGAGLGGNGGSLVEEEGFFVVDKDLNIGMQVDNDGLHAQNILEYKIVEY